MKREQFEISIDHAIMKAAKASFDTCLKAAIAKAISKGRRTCVIETEVRSDEDKLVAKFQFTGFFYEK